MDGILEKRAAGMGWWKLLSTDHTRALGAVWSDARETKNGADSARSAEASDSQTRMQTKSTERPIAGRADK